MKLSPDSISVEFLRKETVTVGAGVGGVGLKGARVAGIGIPGT